MILCIELWPGNAGYGYEWETAAYVPAITWLFSGIISGVLFFAAAAVITYLDGIREYLRAMASGREEEKVQDEVRGPEDQ